MKICIACSAGGHLTEMLQLKDFYSKYPRFFVSFKREDSAEILKNEKTYFITDPKRNLFKLIQCIFQSFFIMIKERPRITISNGAGVGVVVCYMAKLVGSKIIFIEGFSRIEEPSFAGKLVYPISNLFIVQWEELLKKYGKKATYCGVSI